MATIKKSFTLGSDPEVFLERAGRPISAVGLIPGTKKRPFKIGEYESVQLDNVALEFNIKPSTTPEEFIESLEVCYRWAQDHLGSIDPEIQLLLSASAEFEDSELQTREAMMFGCEPDFNAWDNGFPNCSPSAQSNLRSCGGHIHIGIEKEGEGDLDVNRLIRLMDSYVGTYTADVCGDRKRQSLYGKPGAYRPKPYGVEYRTPSISWLKQEDTIRGVFDRVSEAIDAYNKGEDADPFVRNQLQVEEILY